MKQSMRLNGTALTIGFLAATLALTGCGGEFFTPVNNNPTGTGSTSYAYVINTGGTLAEYSLASGTLAALSGSPITLPVAATAVAVSPNDEFLYVGTGTGVFLYTIGSNGTLTEGNSDTVIYLNQTITAPVVQSMVIDPSGSWLIMAYQNSTTIDAIPVSASTGLPTSTSPFTVTTSFATPKPQLAISQANTQVFVALGTGGTEVYGFTHSATTSTPWGTSVSIPLATPKTSDDAVSVDPTSTYLFIAEANNATSTSAGSVRMIKTTSLLTDLGDYPTGVGPSAVLADLSGVYVYVANGADATISGFSIDTTSQTLKSLGSTTPTETSPIALVEDKSKSYIFDVGNGANPNLWLYSFDSSSLGALDVKTSTSTATVNPALANGIAITH